MAQPGFIFGAGTADTYESLQAKRKTAERLGLAAMRTPQNLGEGLSSLGQAIAYRRLMGQADRGEAAGRAAYDEKRGSVLGALMGGALGGGGTPGFNPSAAPVTANAASPVGGALDWTKFAVGGGTRPDAITGLADPFEASLASMFSAAPPEIQAGLRLESGYRSEKRQAELYAEAVKKYGSEEAARKWVAPPGNSQHNHGSAADLKFLDPKAQEWVHQNAASYGLTFPMAHEPWHVEPVGARAGSGGTGGNASTGMNPGASIPAIMEIMSDPYATEADKTVLGMLLQQQMTAMQPPDPMQALDMEYKRAQIDQMKNPAVDPMDAVNMEQALLNLEQDKAGPPPDAPPTSVQEYQYYADQAKAAGQPALSYEEWDLRGKKAGASSTSVDLGGGSDKQIFDAMLVDRNMAQASVSALTALNEAEAAVDGGIVSGPGANTLLLGQKVAAAFGYDPQEIVNTETFVSAMAPVVAATLKASAGTANLSNADMEFAKKAAAGDITLEAKSIKRLLKILRTANETTVKTYNDRLNGVYPDAEDSDTKRSRAMLRVGDIPAYTPPAPAADPVVDAPAPPAFLSNPVILKAAKDAGSGVTAQDIWDQMSPDVRAKYGASQ